MCCKIRPEQPNTSFCTPELESVKRILYYCNIKVFSVYNTPKRDRLLRALPPPAPPFGRNRATQAPRVPRPDLLGIACALLRRPGGTRPGPGARPWGSRLQ